MADQSSNNYDPDILDPEDIVVTVILEDDSELECEILTIFTVDDQDYIALLPLDEHEQVREEEGIYLYRYFEEGDNFEIDNIETDEEYNRVSEALNQIFEEAGL